MVQKKYKDSSCGRKENKGVLPSGRSLVVGVV